MFGILTAWIRDRWAVAAMQAGFFILGSSALFSFALRPAVALLPGVLLIPIGVAALGMLQLALGWTVSPWDTVTSVATWLTHGVAMLMAFLIGTTSRFRVQIREWLFWFATFVAVLGIVQNVTGGGRVFWVFDSGSTESVMGVFVYRNKFAQFLELFLPFALFRAVESSRPLAGIGAAAVMIVGSIAAGSRSGLVIIAVEAITFFWLMRRGRWLDGNRAVKLSLQAGLLVLIAGGVVGLDFIQSRFKQNLLYDVRIPIGLATVDMIKEHPWIGVGLGAWPAAYPEFAHLDTGVFVNQAHCDWLQWTAEGGLPMLVLMLWLAVIAGRVGLDRPWSIGVLFVFIHGMVDYPMQQVPQFATLVMAVLSLAWADRQALRSGGIPGQHMDDRAFRRGSL
ncbi:MAG: O-antigen ligase family protein [Acidobacteria bacterium]|nr:O-antigen ligase family protein [Acidobacteriota bacterium]